MIKYIEILYINDSILNNLNWMEFEIHKDPIRSLKSDGIQFRIKAKANANLPENLLNIGPFQITDTTSLDYWVNKCLFCRIQIPNQTIPITFGLYPTSIELMGNEFEMICEDAYEKILSNYDMGKLAKLHGTQVSAVGVYSVYFTKLMNLVTDLLKDITTKANIVYPSLKLTSPKAILDNKVDDSDYLVKKNETIINSNVMNVAQFLLDQGWYKCPTYSFFDTFNTLTFNQNINFSINYLFLNLGLMLKPNNEIYKPLEVNKYLVNITPVPFFDENFYNLVNNSKKINYDFINRGGFDTCLDDGSFEAADTDKRIEVPIIGESKENSKRKLSCLLKLINLQPQVVNVSCNDLGSMQEVEFNRFYQFLPTTTKAFFPIVINYKFVANIDKNVMLTEFNNATQSNFSFEMNLKCLQFDTKRINDQSMSQLTINGEPCSLIN